MAKPRRINLKPLEQIRAAHAAGVAIRVHEQRIGTGEGCDLRFRGFFWGEFEVEYLALTQRAMRQVGNEGLGEQKPADHAASGLYS